MKLIKRYQNPFEPLKAQKKVAQGIRAISSLVGKNQENSNVNTNGTRVRSDFGYTDDNGNKVNNPSNDQIRNNWQTDDSGVPVEHGMRELVVTPNGSHLSGKSYSESLSNDDKDKQFIDNIRKSRKPWIGPLASLYTLPFSQFLPIGNLASQGGKVVSTLFQPSKWSWLGSKTLGEVSPISGLVADSAVDAVYMSKAGNELYDMYKNGKLGMNFDTLKNSYYLFPMNNIFNTLK